MWGRIKEQKLDMINIGGSSNKNNNNEINNKSNKFVGN